MKNLKITKGEWEAEVFITKRASIKTKNKGFFVDCWGGGIAGIENVDEVEANAQLIADAGTTANKCGKFPSELLDERDELISVLKSCVLSMISHPDCNENSEFEAFVNKGWEIMNKITAK